MIILYVLLGLFFLLIIASVFPIRVKVAYTKDLQITVRYLFLLFFFPKQKKASSKTANFSLKRKVTENRKPDKKRTSYIKNIIEKYGFIEFLSFIQNVIKDLSVEIKKLLTHVILNQVVVNITVSAENAAKTAIYYAHICTMVYNSINFLTTNVRTCRSYDISVEPNFNSSDSKIKACVHVRVKIIFLVFYSIRILIKVLRAHCKMEKQKNFKEIEKI